jgi:outer membrane receptor protein involved in Fe transport
MRRNLGSVYVNEAQSNPLQPDVQYRGFSGSPLLGLPQGLAVYMDGVRLNEPFGDTVHWALLPESAIASMVLMPGSNPLFGLNALGGAISIRTKDGFSASGTSVTASTGSFGRTRLAGETGNASEDFGYFVTGQYIEEDGWRDFSPVAAMQLFGKIGWRRDKADIDLSVGLADTDLTGNGPAPVELLALDRRAIFTRPDITENTLGMVELSVDYALSETLSLNGNVYARRSDIDSLNGDESEFEACSDAPELLCTQEGGVEEIVRGPDDLPIGADPALEGAAINRTRTAQDGVGFGVQGSWSHRLRQRENSMVFGLVYDQAASDFAASTELGALDATRFAVPGGVFVGDAFTRLDADTSTLGLFLSNTLYLTEYVSLNVSGRFNESRIRLRDRLGTALDGDHSFSRFNPAISITAHLSDAITIYGRFSESARAPSPVELTCADQEDPCRLPNAFLADPPLKQVVARSLEAGLRGQSLSSSWHVGLFRTTNLDDISFVSAGALTNQGYFTNVGRTRRAGVELNFEGIAGRTSWYANYTFLDAMFRQRLLLPSAHNPAATDGEILVKPGDRLPLLPKHLLKAGIERPIRNRVTLGANLSASSGFHLRGDEGNRVGEVGQHVVISLYAGYEPSEKLRLFLNVDNAFDTEYESFGLFGDPSEVLGAGFTEPRFLSPAAPRAAWVGVEYRLR